MNALTIEECRAMASRMKEVDKALFISLLLCGSRARTWTWSGALKQVVDLPSAVYQQLRALATEHELVLVPFNFARVMDAHWLGGVKLNTPVFTSDKSDGEPWTTQEVSRRMKRYARLVGLDESAVNLRAVLNTHRLLFSTFRSMDEAAEMLGLSPHPPSPDRWSQARNIGQATWSTTSHSLHGIGRRSGSRRLSSRSE